MQSFEQVILINKISYLAEQYNQFKGQITPIKDIYPLIKEFLVSSNIKIYIVI
jgi:hypothetical protein